MASIMVMATDVSERRAQHHEARPPNERKLTSVVSNRFKCSRSNNAFYDIQGTSIVQVTASTMERGSGVRPATTPPSTAPVSLLRQANLDAPLAALKRIEAEPSAAAAAVQSTVQRSRETVQEVIALSHAAAGKELDAQLRDLVPGNIRHARGAERNRTLFLAAVVSGDPSCADSLARGPTAASGLVDVVCGKPHVSTTERQWAMLTLSDIARRPLGPPRLLEAGLPRCLHDVLSHAIEAQKRRDGRPPFPDGDGGSAADDASTHVAAMGLAYAAAATIANLSLTVDGANAALRGSLLPLLVDLIIGARGAVSLPSTRWLFTGKRTMLTHACIGGVISRALLNMAMTSTDCLIWLRTSTAAERLRALRTDRQTSVHVREIASSCLHVLGPAVPKNLPSWRNRPPLPPPLAPPVPATGVAPAVLALLGTTDLHLAAAACSGSSSSVDSITTGAPTDVASPTASSLDSTSSTSSEVEAQTAGDGPRLHDADGQSVDVADGGCGDADGGASRDAELSNVDDVDDAICTDAGEDATSQAEVRERSLMRLRKRRRPDDDGTSASLGGGSSSGHGGGSGGGGSSGGNSGRTSRSGGERGEAKGEAKSASRAAVEMEFECILSRRLKSRKLEYLVKWKSKGSRRPDYEDEATSWVAAHHLHDPHAVASYERMGHTRPSRTPRPPLSAPLKCAFVEALPFLVLSPPRL